MRHSFKDLTFEELITKREELKRKYLDLRVNMVVGHVDNALEKKLLRRWIARLNTLIFNHAEPVAQVKNNEQVGEKSGSRT